MIKIRSLNIADDFSGLITLSRAFFKEYEAHHTDFFRIAELKDQDITSYFASFCGQDSRKAYIAVDGEWMVGYITAYVKDQASYWEVKRLGEISGLMVREEYRHQGIAGRLLAEVKTFFRVAGVRYFTVYTSAANQAGLDFYRVNGLIPLYTTLLGSV